MTRGERNCNPLNIRRVAGSRKPHWRGEVVSPIEDKEFVQFASVEWGLRAAFQILHTYREKHQAVCIEDIISRWAPPSENDTARYVRTVCALTGLGGRERLTESQWPGLVRAMARIESNMDIEPHALAEGYRLYQKLKNQKI